MSSNAATLGTASWPDTYQEAKLKVLESLDEKRSRSDRTTGFVFNTLPSFTRNPIAFLERINAVLLGLGSRAVTQTTSNEMRLKSRKLFDNAGQGPGEDLRTYIIRFDSVVSNLRKVYSDTFETSFNELEIVQRFLNSLLDKTAYTHYSYSSV